MESITQEIVRSSLCYNPVTGIVTRNGKQVGYDNGQGYLKIIINKKRCFLHRIIWLWMTGSWPKHQIDHINRIRNDNRWINLRECTHTQNQHNRTINKNNKSGFSGVFWIERLGKWQACAPMDRKKVYLGVYKTAKEAYEARLRFLSEENASAAPPKRKHASINQEAT